MFKVISRVNGPLAITLDTETSVYLQPHGVSQEIDDKFLNCPGIAALKSSGQIVTETIVSKSEITPKAKRGQGK